MPNLLAGELVMDYGLYPRTAISAHHVNELADALDAGAKFPPIVINASTRAIIDGFHRTAAVIRSQGAEGMIAVEEREYASEAEAFLDALRLNTAHGLNLTSYDRVRAVSIAEGLSIDAERLAASLHTPVDRLQVLRARTVVGSDGETVALKASLRHLQGKPVTDAQISAIKKAGGFHVTFYVNQIVNAIRGDLINGDSPAVREKLVLLREVVTEYLARTTSES